jgi:tRNA threonylcarbamoyl adenosine modification protein YeaZ
MLTLILETSSEKGLLVLAKNGVPLASKRLSGGPELSKMLALEVKNLLNGEIPELIAVGTGPGSYTGIRVGSALAKALSYGWNVPLMGFCSLKAFGPSPVLVDARMGGFYALLDGVPQRISPTDPRIQNLPYIRSPHPELIGKRLQTTAIFEQTEAGPALLAQIIYHQFLEEGIAPLELTYLIAP